MNTSQAAHVAIGTRRMSFTMQPCGPDGRPINGGNHYANANTLDGAREYARDVLARVDYFGYRVDSVKIDGSLFEFKGHAWVSLHRDYHSEVVHSEF